MCWGRYDGGDVAQVENISCLCLLVQKTVYRTTHLDLLFPPPEPPPRRNRVLQAIVNAPEKTSATPSPFLAEHSMYLAPISLATASPCSGVTGVCPNRFPSSALWNYGERPRAYLEPKASALYDRPAAGLSWSQRE